MPPLEPSWQARLGSEFEKPYMDHLRDFLKSEKQKKKVIYPKSSDIFNAFLYTPFDEVKVVIVGQDPYHGPGQAHGLCFSVQPGVAVPPSLLNIYKELKADVGIQPPRHGCLTHWAEQGVLLLNSVLTVEQFRAGSHQGKGWEEFTDAAIQQLNEHRKHIVFVLWGNYAQKKGAFIDTRRHHVIKSVHPSPLSASRGFLGSKPFSQINRYLAAHHQKSIEWSLPEYASKTSALPA